MQAKKLLHLGIDVGSTTVKVAVVNPEDQSLLYSQYVPHKARQAATLSDVLSNVKDAFPDFCFRAIITGSGGAALAEPLGISFIQEVVANSLAIDFLHPGTRTAIELGGQDAKMIFLAEGEGGHMQVRDMRMNGTCAGGTGAFIEEMATLMRVDISDFNDLASCGSTVYSISGRCGVFAKTDIQPLLNQGVSKEDLALSVYHAIAKQTVGGLAQGLDIVPPVIFEGGPLTYHPRLISVFAERLGLNDEQVIIPEHADTMVAYGAALALSGVFADASTDLPMDEAIHNLTKEGFVSDDGATRQKPYFESEEELAEFKKRHQLAQPLSYMPACGDIIDAYLGIDSGSTTLKMVLLDSRGELIDSFYGSNEGDPLVIARKALMDIFEKYRDAGATLNIRGLGTTGYGEMLFAEAFGADCHTVETVAHSVAAQRYVPDVSFILDIGGQDMKALWVNDGIITDILVNEACSSGCGSFLENFATNLGIRTEDIADMAFSSKEPASLGSRCTVFMNSSIVTEQRNGKTPADIMAGLCRSIILNVFTKVVRIPNLDVLGDKIVVQGGTLLNDAVLAAFEQYVGKDVVRAPYPGLMGALGAALITMSKFEGSGVAESSFIGYDALRDFSYDRQTGVLCPFCSNHCNRTVVRFSSGNSYVTGNRCLKGEVLGDPKDEGTRSLIKQVSHEQGLHANLFETRQRLLFSEYECAQAVPRGVKIGLPRVLSLWEYAPFWTTLLRSLGFEVVLSDLSSRAQYESGLSAIPSDTVCFPAKLVHGHIRDLAAKNVDRIFMPSVTVVESENQEETSESMCAVVKGYPLVLRNSDNPEALWNIPFDAPLFHWYTHDDCRRQLSSYLKSSFDIDEATSHRAIEFALAAQNSFQAKLKAEGSRVIDKVLSDDGFAIVLASRPYQNDALVNHDIPGMLNKYGVDVLTADSIPDVNDVDLMKSRIDVVNNFHARMLGSAVLCAQRDYLEYIQVVSFGCGHDAYLTDEIIRLMHEISGKSPLVLKVDESDAQGSIGIRIRSFLETIKMKRAKHRKPQIHELDDPYPNKYLKSHKKTKTVLVPNTSHAFSRLMAVAFASQGLLTYSLPVGRDEASRLGKKYVHNDICFPAQIVIGEAIEALNSGQFDPDNCAIGMGRYIGDCRLTHYSALLRKALDDAGYPQVPIITNDDVDSHNMHPGYKMSLPAAIKIAYGLPMIDCLEELLRKIRPYELHEGDAQRAFDYGIDEIMDGMSSKGIRGAKKGFEKAIERFNQVEYDRSNPRPTVLIVGEYLLNFHPGANRDIEGYLENNGFEIIEARMADVIRKTYFYKASQVKEYKVNRPLGYKISNCVSNWFFELAHDATDKIAIRHPLYQPATRMPELVKGSDDVIPHTFDAGEGVLIPGEIIHYANHGCRNFVILQPFGCLPNHIVGRGIVKKLREMCPDAQILPLDFDPDVSTANIENRLQMLIMNEKVIHQG